MASGSGSNLQALIDDQAIRAHVRLVLSDRRDAGALDRAKKAGIPTAVVEFADYSDRPSFSDEIADRVDESGAKGVVLAGFMRVLSPNFIDRFPGRVLNIHPSLLPSFPGAHGVRSALEHGVKVTGVTVHIVDHGVDTGPIVAQRPVPVEPDDSEESLHARIQEVEHQLYPVVVKALIEDRL